MSIEIVTPRGAVVMVKPPGGKQRTELVWDPSFAGNRTGDFNMAQKFIDNEVLRVCDPYIPKRTGMLIKSGILGTVVGSGMVKWLAPYAKLQYYSSRAPGSSTGRLRGPQWFPRAMNVHRDRIIAGAAKIAGGRPYPK